MKAGRTSLKVNKIGKLFAILRRKTRKYYKTHCTTVKSQMVSVLELRWRTETLLLLRGRCLDT